MTRKSSIFFITFLHAIFIIIFPLSTYAYNDASMYGDNTEITWNDVQPHLSPIYKNTPSISISNGNTTKQFSFNIEMFWDLGLYVYGDPSSVSFTDVTNDFKVADYGYFTSPSTNKKGEYRYLGYSLYGVPITNKRFPNDLPPIPYDDMTLLKYSELPDYLKKSYNIYGINNSHYMPIRNVIESPNSPVWNFTNFTNGKEVSLRQTLANVGLFKDNKPLISLLDYGIVYTWNESGGIIRFFYCAKSDRNIIRYATFSGPVLLDLNACLPALNSNLYLTDDLGMPTNNIFNSKTPQGNISLNINIDGILKDNFNNLSYFQKLYSYTRNDIEEFNLYIDNKKVTPLISANEKNHLSKSGRLQEYTFYFSNLQEGKNKFTINGLAEVKIRSSYIQAPCTLDFYINFENAESSTPCPTNTPNHETVTPAAPTSTPPTPPIHVPARIPKIIIRRMW